MTPARPPTIDPRAAARWQQALTPQSPWLHEEVARRMADRLAWIRLQPGAWAHWEPLRGGVGAHALLAQRYPRADCFVVEGDDLRARQAARAMARPWWSPARWTAPPTRFQSPPEAGVQMVWANMALHMAADPQALVTRWQRALAVDGFLMFSCLGPDTLRELRGLYQLLGWPAPSHEFTDMHDWGDMLVKAGFAEPVMDMERITLTFETPRRLLQELRELGRNLHPGRFPHLRGRQWREQLHQALSKQLADPEQAGRLTLTFEIIYGHALKPRPRMALGPETKFSLDDMRTSLRGRKSFEPGH